MPKDSKKEHKKSMRPAITPEAREDQLICLATDLAERQLREGTASSQVISHYLKLGSTRERLERERLEVENEMLRAKTESLQSSKKVENLYMQALNAMRRYSGQESEDNYDEDDEWN